MAYLYEHVGTSRSSTLVSKISNNSSGILDLISLNSQVFL